MKNFLKLLLLIGFLIYSDSSAIADNKIKIDISDVLYSNTDISCKEDDEYIEINTFCKECINITDQNINYINLANEINKKIDEYLPILDKRMKIKYKSKSFIVNDINDVLNNIKFPYIMNIFSLEHKNAIIYSNDMKLELKKLADNNIKKITIKPIMTELFGSLSYTCTYLNFRYNKISKTWMTNLNTKMVCEPTHEERITNAVKLKINRNTTNIQNNDILEKLENELNILENEKNKFLQYRKQNYNDTCENLKRCLRKGQSTPQEECFIKYRTFLVKINL
jgi:hypothetical protein